MRKSKKVAAFLMALAVVSMNVPLMYSGINNSVAYAEEETQEIFQFTKQPQSQTASIGKTIEFTVEVSGTQNIAYQWQYSSNNGKTWNNSTTGYPKTATLSVEATEKRNGNMYRCIVSDGTTILTSESATLTVGEEFAIKKQPQSQTASVGKIVEFSVGVSEGYNTSYQWKYYSPSTKVWKNCTLGNPNTATLSVEATDSRNGYKYKCVVTDGTTTLISEIATLTIGEEFAINKQPQSQTVSVGAAAIFSVDVTGSDNIAYQWQYSSNNGKTWNNSTSGNPTTNTLSVEATNKRSGNRYRCIVSNGSTILTSTPALLTVTDKEEFKITESPEDVTAILNTDITFHIATNVGNATYQWQWRNSANGTWANSSTGNPTTDTLTVNATLRRNGYQYRCVVSDGTTTLESDPVTLIVREKEEFKITESPVNLIAVSNTDITFHIVTNDENATYQWQWRTGVNGTWKSSTTGNPTTDRLTVKAESKRNGYQYRCIVSDGITTLTSNPATLTIASPITLTDPSNLTITPSDSATFTVTATGTGDLTYAWESSTDGTTWSAISGANVATLTVSGSDAVDGTQYRCTVSDNYGQSVTSNAATLTVRNLITLSELVDTTAVEDKNVTFSINAEGADNLTYQWQTAVAPKDENTPIDWTDITSATSSTYIFKAKYNLNGRLYRCLVSTSTETVNSSVATLTVTPAYTVLSNTTKEISMNLGDACQLDATGTGLRYYSNTTALTVDKNGVVTANDTCTGYVFVLDRYGHKTFYKIHVDDPYEALEFDETVVSVRPGQSVHLYTNKDAEFMVSDTDRATIETLDSYAQGYMGYGVNFYAEVPGEYDVIAYNSDGEMSTSTVIVEGDVTDAVAGTEYQGEADEDSNIWYRYTNNSDKLVMVTFDYYSIYGDAVELSEDETSDLFDGCFSIYEEGNWIYTGWTYGAELENKRIFLEPGQELYVNPHAYEMAAAAYDFKIHVTPYATKNYTVGTTVGDVVLDRKDFTDYVFTTGAAGEYDLMANSMNKFYWQLKDDESDEWLVNEGTEDDGAVSTSFALKGNHRYALYFAPNDLSQSGSLIFTMTKENDTESATVGEQNQKVVGKNSTKYYSLTIGTSENPRLDVYEFIGSGDYISYEVLGPDMYTAYDKKDQFGRYYATEPTTIYVKATNYDSNNRYALFTLKKYERNVVRTNEPLPKDSANYTEDELSKYQVNWYAFTAPVTGIYYWGIEQDTDSDVSVQCEFFEQGLNSKSYVYNDYGYGKYSGYPLLRAGETVYVKVTGDYYSDANSKAKYKWFFELDTEFDVTDLALDTPTAGATVDGQPTYFKFTAPEKGTYYFWSQARANMRGSLYHELAGDSFRSDSSGGYSDNFCIEYRMGEGETVYLLPEKYVYSSDDNKDCEYEVVVSRTNTAQDWRPTYDHQALTLGTAKNGHYTDSYLFDTFSFTATEAGTYVFTGASSDESISGYLYSDAALTNQIAENNGSSFRVTYDLAEGQTVYLKPYSYYSADLDYTVKVDKRNISNAQISNGRVYTNQVLAPESEIWYAFTAPSFDIDECCYYFSIESDKYMGIDAYKKDENGEYQGCDYTWGTTSGTVGVYLNPGETAYIKTTASDPSDTVQYALTVSGGMDVGDRSFVLPEAYNVPSDYSRSFGSSETEMWVKIENPNQLEYNLTFESTEDPSRTLLVEFYTADGELLNPDEEAGSSITVINPFAEMTADDSTVYYVHIVEQGDVALGGIQVSYEPVVVEEGGED